MDLSNYLKDIKESNCHECGIREISEIVLLPPPSRISGIIISRDPTVDFLHLYKYLEDKDNDYQRYMLFAHAIPVSLLVKILIFLKKSSPKKVTNEIETRLFDIILTQTYWTHLHKCITDSTNPSLKYKTPHAQSCANRWLGKELGYAIDNKTKFIITLGNDVQAWIDKYTRNKEISFDILNLPHPSGQNNPLWYRSEKAKYKSKIDTMNIVINRLLTLCKSIHG
jgi:hypothetical protein